jgi:toxin FitB
VIVLDTNVLSELIKAAPDQRVIDWVDRQDSAEVALTAITAAEMRAGAALLPRGRRRTTLTARIDVLITEGFTGAVLPFGVGATGYYAQIVAERRQAGTPISALDAQIAAICRQYDARLATRNGRDFVRTGIDLVDPWEPLTDSG